MVQWQCLFSELVQSKKTMVHEIRFSRADVGATLLIVLLAFTFRLIVIVDRAYAADKGSAFDPLPVGSDQLTYYNHVAAYARGEFPPQHFFYQPGMSYFLIGAVKLMRTDNLGALRVLIAWLAAVNCGLLVLVTRLLWEKRTVAWLAGCLLAIYPVSAFYDTDFVITSQATELLTLALLGVALMWRYPRNPLGVLLYGGAFGVLAFTRFDTLFVAPVMAMWLLKQRPERLTWAQVFAAVVVSVIVVSPVVVHNVRNGADYLLTPAGAMEMYRGNHRDADGTYSFRQASATTSTDYIAYLWKDVQLSPQRFGELLLHKVGLYFSKDEPGNNLNYVLSGERFSPLLRAVPLDYTKLAALFLLGLALSFHSPHRAMAGLFGGAFLALMGAVFLIWVEARVRTPSVIFMLPPAAYGIVNVAERLRQAVRKCAWLLVLRSIATAAIPVALVLGAAHWAYRNLPRPLTVSTLPNTAHPDGRIFDDTLQLVGWQVQEQYSPAGIIQPFRPYVVTFYWQLVHPTAVDYSFSLGFYVSGERVLGVDRPIGTVSYPDHPTSTWQVGTIYVEHVGLAYKRFDGPVGVSGALLLSVYPERDATHLLMAEGEGTPTTHILIAQPAIIWDTGTLPEDMRPPYADISFGDVLQLKAWRFPTTIRAGQPFTVTLGWQTTATPIKRNLIFGTGLLDADGALVTNMDSPPYDGALLATSLPTQYLFTDAKTLTAPKVPGVYTVYVVVYDYETGTRLPIADVADDVLILGTLTVQAP